MKDKLNMYSKNITSQHGEDGILEYIITSLDGKINNICCEFGAWDGIFASNTYNLWKNKNWHAILIEGDKDKYDDLITNTKNLDHVNSIHSFVQLKLSILPRSALEGKRNRVGHVQLSVIVHPSYS